MSGACGRSRAAPWLFLTPALVFLGLFAVWPTLRAAWWSLTGADLLDVGAARWVGAANYSDLLGDPRFRRAFLNTAVFAAMVVPLQTALAFFLALWVNRPERCWRWLRTVFFVPVVVSMPVLAVLWSMLYQPMRGGQSGLVNALVAGLGLPPQEWLQDPRLALPAIAFMSVWQGVGFQMMIFLAGLQNLSKEQLEAATMDGAGAGQRLRHVILPAMRPSVVFVLTATTILSFRLFVQPYLMTRGGPADSTVSVIQFVYETTFLGRELGVASAGAMLFLGLVAVIAAVQRRAAREERA
jgi:ABC-type sugar transport system permease subunit